MVLLDPKVGKGIMLLWLLLRRATEIRRNSVVVHGMPHIHVHRIRSAAATVHHHSIASAAVHHHSIASAAVHFSKTRCQWPDSWS